MNNCRRYRVVQHLRKYPVCSHMSFNLQISLIHPHSPTNLHILLKRPATDHTLIRSLSRMCSHMLCVGELAIKRASTQFTNIDRSVEMRVDGQRRGTGQSVWGECNLGTCCTCSTVMISQTR